MMLTGYFVIATLLAPLALSVSAFQEGRVIARAAVSVPDTPAGKALNEFIESFNTGGDKRKAFIEERTTIPKEAHANILAQDTKFLQTNGAMTLVRVPSSSGDNITAVLRFATGGMHVHLTLELDPAAPGKVANMRLRPATPEEIKGGL